MKLSSPFSVKSIYCRVETGEYQEEDLGYLVADSPQGINECFYFSCSSWGFLTVKSNLNQLADKHGPLEIKRPELFTGKL